MPWDARTFALNPLLIVPRLHGYPPATSIGIGCRRLQATTSFAAAWLPDDGDLRPTAVVIETSVLVCKHVSGDSGWSARNRCSYMCVAQKRRSCGFSYFMIPSGDKGARSCGSHRRCAQLVWNGPAESDQSRHPGVLQPRLAERGVSVVLLGLRRGTSSGFCVVCVSKGSSRVS